MRMSLSRLAAFGLAFMAGVTLASCASSSAPFPGTGPNPQTISFPGGASRVRFVQGSPNLNLGINLVDLYIDNKFAGTYSYGTVGAWIYSLPIGVHRFQLVQAGTTNPVFLDSTFTVTANNKYTLIAQGDAAVHSTKFTFVTTPHYTTPSGAVAASFFNASPRNSPAVMFYNCMTGGPACLNGVASNTILFHSVNDGWCFAAVNGVTVVGSNPLGTNPVTGTCATVFLVPTTTAPLNNIEFFLIDDVATPGSILLTSTGQQNG
jgi:hypothetical protein